MCSAITHLAGRELKMIEGLYGKGKRREVSVEDFNIGGLGKRISIKLAPPIRKLSVSLKCLE